ncbi:hypothetical protein TNCV_3318771 [Trichonephila clavipes]|nr:hypothetical protein TNCV_3318771 [Trichonephila clavipes]
MSLRRFRRQYKQLSQFERERIISMMDAGWLDMLVAHPLGRSDCVQGCRQIASAKLSPFLGLLDTHICHQLSISGIISDDRVDSQSLFKLEARLQQMLNQMSHDFLRSLYALMLTRIASGIRARMGITEY